MQYLNKQERYKMAAQNTVSGNGANVESIDQLKDRKYIEIRSPKPPSSHLRLYSPSALPNSGKYCIKLFQMYPMLCVHPRLFKIMKSIQNIKGI
jgi:hypothetical protein